MVKILLIIFVIIVIFSSALYLGIFQLIGLNIAVVNSDFLPYIPVEIRLGFFLILLGLIIATAKGFIN